MSDSALDTRPVDPDLAQQAKPGHGVPSQDPDPAAQHALDASRAQSEAESVYVGGAALAGAAGGAAMGAAVAGPVGVVVGGTVGLVAGAVGGAAAGRMVGSRERGADADAAEGAGVEDR